MSADEGRLWGEVRVRTGFEGWMWAGGWGGRRGGHDFLGGGKRKKWKGGGRKWLLDFGGGLFIFGYCMRNDFLGSDGGRLREKRPEDKRM